MGIKIWKSIFRNKKIITGMKKDEMFHGRATGEKRRQPGTKKRGTPMR